MRRRAAARRAAVRGAEASRQRRRARRPSQGCAPTRPRAAPIDVTAYHDRHDRRGAASAGSTVRARPARSPSTPRPPRSTRCRPISSASRSPSRRAHACYIPLGHVAWAAAICFPAAGLRARPDARGRSARAAEAAAGRPRRAQDRPERQIRLAHVPPARHRGRADRRHDADVLCARLRRDQRRPRHGRAERALARPQADPVLRSRRLRQELHRLRARADRPRDPICRRGRRRHLAPVARC